MDSISVGMAVGGFVIGMATVTGRWCYTWLKQRRHHRQEGTNLKMLAGLDLQIHDLLTELRVISGAARAAVFQFHNGEHFYSGSSIQRVSCTHESVIGGVGLSQHLQSNVPASMLAPIIEPMLAHKSGEPIEVRQIDDLADSHIKSVLMNLNVMAVAHVPLRQGEYKTVGFVEFHWMDLDRICEGTDVLVGQFVQRIEALLMVRLEATIAEG